MKMSNKEKQIIEDGKVFLNDKMLTEKEKKRISCKLYYWFKLQEKRTNLVESTPKQ